MDTIGAGNWEAVANLLRDEGVNLVSQAVPDARVGSLMRRPRYNEILGNGNLDGSNRIGCLGFQYQCQIAQGSSESIYPACFYAASGLSSGLRMSPSQIL